MPACRGARVASALLAAGLVACAGPSGTKQDSAAEAPVSAGQQACFYRRQVQDFQVLDRSSLVVFAPSRRNAYLVKISPPANDLRMADAIAFDSRSNQICGRAGDGLQIGTSAPRRYFVADVRRLEPGQLDALLSSYGKGEAGAGLEPETDTAADIEPVESAADQ